MGIGCSVFCFTDEGQCERFKVCTSLECSARDTRHAFRDNVLRFCLIFYAGDSDTGGGILIIEIVQTGQILRVIRRPTLEHGHNGTFSEIIRRGQGDQILQVHAAVAVDIAGHQGNIGNQVVIVGGQIHVTALHNDIPDRVIQMSRLGDHEIVDAIRHTGDDKLLCAEARSGSGEACHRIPHGIPLAQLHGTTHTGKIAGDSSPYRHAGCPGGDILGCIGGNAGKDLPGQRQTKNNRCREDVP